MLDQQTAPVAASSHRHWVCLVNPTPEELTAAQQRFDLHPLVVEDLLADRLQPKAERIGDHLYLTTWDVDMEDPATSDMDLALILTSDLLVVIQRGTPDRLRPLERLLTEKGTVRVDSPIAATYRILNAIVSDFVTPGTQVVSELGELEADVFDGEVREDYEQVYRLRQQIGRIDRAVQGLSETLQEARPDIRRATADYPELRPYFQHLANDAHGVARLARAEHASLDAIVSSHESNVAARQNQDMRTISAFAALLAIPTVVAGIYGMNFKNIPLVQWSGGWVVIGISLVVVDVIAYLMFRRQGWLGKKRPPQE